MLGKLIKHEFLDTYKIICTYYAVLAIFTVLGVIVVNSAQFPKISQSLLLQIFMVIVSLGYTVILGVLGLITVLALCTHFNNTMYGDRGYLTHTLPVSKGSILASKYIVSIVWCIASLLMMFISVMIEQSVLTNENFFIKLLFQTDAQEWKYLDEFVKNTFGCGLIPFLVLVFLSLIATVMHLFSFIWMAISIGQLANEKRKLTGIIAGIAIWFAEFLIKWFTRRILRLSFFYGLTELLFMESNKAMHGDQILLLAIVSELVFFAIETFGIWFISSKKLNLA